MCAEAWKDIGKITYPNENNGGLEKNHKEIYDSNRRLHMCFANACILVRTNLRQQGRNTVMAYFPLFIDIEKKPCLVAGGGRVALRKVQVLLDFGADVMVIAPVILKEIKEIQAVTIREREVLPGDLENKVLVVAATDDAAANHQIGENCKEKGILVNAVDQIEDCTFLFPAYVKQKDVVAAFSSSGKSPVLAQYLKAQEEKILTEQIGSMNDLLGNIRARIKQLFDTEEERKCVYQAILMSGISKACIPTDKEIETIIAKFKATEK